MTPRRRCAALYLRPRPTRPSASSTRAAAEHGADVAVLHLPALRLGRLLLLPQPPGLGRGARRRRATRRSASTCPATGDSGGEPERSGPAGGLDDRRRRRRRLAARRDRRPPRVAAIGIGLGGLVACRGDRPRAPRSTTSCSGRCPARGRTLLRELRVFARLNATEVDASDAIARPAVPEPPPLPDGSLEVGGFLLDAETVAALEALDLTKLAIPGDPRRRVADARARRDRGRPPPARAPRGRRRRGHASRPGPATGTMMAHPQQARPPRGRVRDRVVRWLAEAPRRRARAPPAAGGGRSRRSSSPHRETRIRETPFSIEHPCGRLWGVLCEPARRAGRAVRARSCSTPAPCDGSARAGCGSSSRATGPRAGVPTLRIDLEGLGDSDGDSTPYADTGALYTLALVDQVHRGDGRARGRAGSGRRFLLSGLCAGAYWSFHAALRDPRVVAAFLLNPRALIWDESLDEERDARKIGGVVKGSSWRQVLRGEVSPARMRAITCARPVAARSGPGPPRSSGASPARARRRPGPHARDGQAPAARLRR